MAVNIAQVEIRFTQDNQQVENVFHVAATTPLTSTEADAIFSVVDMWVRVTLRPTQNHTVIYREVEIADVNGVGAPRFVYPGDGLTGGDTNPPAPNNVTFSLKKNSGVSGRKFRGRFYHIGLSNDNLDGNTVGAVALTALVSTYNALMTDLNTASYPLVVAYRDYSGPPPHPIVGGIKVLSITAVDATVDSQRRRLPGRGR